MARLIRAEIYKLSKRSMTYILLLILIGLFALILLITQATTPTATTVTNGITTTAPAVAANVQFLQGVVTSSIAMLGGIIGVVLAVVLVANGMGSEYGWNTIRPYLLCSESRSKMFASKLIADAIFIVAGMIICVITVILLGVLFTAIRGYSWNLGASTLSFTGSQLLDFTRAFYVILPYALLAFLFTVLGRSTATGIGFGIGASVIELIVTGLLASAHGWLAKIPNYMLSINVSKITSLSGTSGGVTISGGPNTPIASSLHAFIVVAVYCVVFTALSYIIFLRRDVTG
jgi:ABC-type transport system involved in multi-copper enzyme maturation permease subunit